MVNLEAAACRTPVITTTATGITRTWAESGGMLVETDLAHLVLALNQAARWTEGERAARGDRLYRLVAAKYSQKATAARWIELYQLLAGAA